MKNLGISLFFVCLFGCADEASNVFSETGGGGQGGTGGQGGIAIDGGGGQGGDNNGGQGGLGGDSGVGGSSGSSCIPKTCTTVAVELSGDTSGASDACGFVSDGCGNFIDCGGCENPHHGCGLGNYETPNMTDEILPGTENLCGGNCVRAFKQDLFFVCANSKDEWLCSAPTLTPPAQGCVPHMASPTSFWCC